MNTPPQSLPNSPSRGLEDLKPKGCPYGNLNTSKKQIDNIIEAPLLDVKPAFYSDGIPVFTPTMEQFEDFYKFQKSINKYGMESGIVKVIPPKEWIKDAKNQLTSESLSKIRFHRPIVQQMSMVNGCVHIDNIEKRNSYNLIQWKKLSTEKNYLIPAPRGEAQEKYKFTSEEKGICDIYKGKINWNKPLEPNTFDKIDYNIDTSIYTIEKCKFLEEQYWKTIFFSNAFYGADTLGSVFQDDFRPWNVSHLPNLLDYMSEKLPGVNDAYLYAGLWKATFSWHLEDQDLHSINYLHFGAPKQWYSIPQRDHTKFYNLMKEVFPQDAKNCSEFLRHKTFLASPKFLEKNNIKVNKIIHNENEFMITYPYGYHSGFNYGYNLAESVNFALDDWLEIGLKSKRCECIPDSVNINVESLMRRFNGEPEPVPEAIKEKNIEDEAGLSFATSRTPKKNKSSFRNVAEKQDKSKSERRKVNNSALKSDTPSQSKSSSISKPQCVLCPNRLAKKLLNSKAFELLKIADFSTNTENKHHDSIYAHRLCVELTPELKVSRESKLYNSLNENGESLDNDSANTFKFEEEVVYGYEEIPNARKNLKCYGCQEKGVCFQCDYKRCLRAYHGTCALENGVLVKNLSVDLTNSINEDDDLTNKDTEKLIDDIKEQLSGTCKNHRKNPKKIRLEDLIEYCYTLKKGDYVQFTINDKPYCGDITSNNISEETLIANIFSPIHSSSMNMNGNSNSYEIMYHQVLFGADEQKIFNSNDDTQASLLLKLKNKHLNQLKIDEKRKLREILREEKLALKKQEVLKKKEEKEEEKRIRNEQKSFQLIEEMSVTGLKDTLNLKLHDLSKVDNVRFLVESISSLETVPSTAPKSLQFYHYLSEISNEKVDKYTENLESMVPVKVKYTRKRQRKSNSPKSGSTKSASPLEKKDDPPLDLSTENKNVLKKQKCTKNNNEISLQPPPMFTFSHNKGLNTNILVGALQNPFQINYANAEAQFPNASDPTPIVVPNIIPSSTQQPTFCNFNAQTFSNAPSMQAFTNPTNNSINGDSRNILTSFDASFNTAKP
ncbi:hypothetical protein B5S33_g71 [[Candida] boidinii]|nr:hypothetical protein B5S33_g71 [[Candida] boidinii]